MITELRALEPHELRAFCNELRDILIQKVSDKIAHLESSLAVTELTVALHYVLNTPDDVLIWDVGHQAYVHKALTGRMHQLETMRTSEGISGFLKRDESAFDVFGAGHASTSISALTGLCLADKANNVFRRRVAVIGDGALTGGQSFEALNHLATIDTEALVILNDNDGSIDQTVGKLHEKGNYKNYFLSLGWEYSECVQGNNPDVLVAAIQRSLVRGGKQILHVRTTRPGLTEAKSYKPGTTFQWWASKQMSELLLKYSKIHLISPAMFAGSGFAPLREGYPDRLHDTGITEPHAVTMAAGMAVGGLMPWVHIYSTFLQRAIDQIIHDVALQNLPVIFLVDRAGIVGADGPTHHGVFDSGMLHDIPGVTIWHPKDGDELQAMMRWAAEIQGELQGPLFIRYPKATTSCGSEVKFKSWELLTRQGSNSLLVSTGALTARVENVLFDHVHLGQTKPLPDGFSDLLKKYDSVVVLEESNGVGGLSGALSSHMAKEDLEAKLVVRKIPDAFTSHGKRDELLRAWGLIP